MNDFADAAGPRVAVVMPLEDHRGMAERAVDSWLQSKGLAGDEFQIILIAQPWHSAIGDRIRPKLRPHDLWVEFEASSELEQYDLGIAEAKSDWIFVTEPHCLAEPNTLAAIRDRFVKHPEEAGFCIRSTPLAKNDLARMEAEMFERGMVDWSHPDRWEKVILRGVGIRREAYRKVGGFQFRYGRFAEWLLAADLRRNQLGMGYERTASVRHLYTESLSALAPFIEDFVRGECLYRLEASRGDVERFFGSPEEWRTGSGRTRSTSISCWRAWNALANEQPELADSLVKDRHRFFRGMILGTGGASGLARLDRWRTGLACQGRRWRRDGLYEAYVRYYEEVVRHARIRFISEHESHFQCPWTCSGDRGALGARDWSPCFAYGFHAQEHHMGSDFRWLEPFSGIHLELSEGTWEVEIVLSSFSPTTTVGIIWNDGWFEPLPQEDSDLKKVRFEIESNGSSGWLHFIHRPVPEPAVGDPRQLAVPLEGVSWVRRAAA